MSYLNKQCWEVVRNGKVVRSKLTRPEAEHELFERVHDYGSYGCGVKSVSASPSFDHFKIVYYPLPNNRTETDVARLEIVKMKDDEDEQDEPVKATEPAPDDVHGGAKSHEFKGDLAYLFND